MRGKKGKEMDVKTDVESESETEVVQRGVGESSAACARRDSENRR